MSLRRHSHADGSSSGVDHNKELQSVRLSTSSSESKSAGQAQIRHVSQLATQGRALSRHASSPASTVLHHGAAPRTPEPIDNTAIVIKKAFQDLSCAIDEYAPIAQRIDYLENILLDRIAAFTPEAVDGGYDKKTVQVVLKTVFQYRDTLSKSQDAQLPGSTGAMRIKFCAQHYNRLLDVVRQFDAVTHDEEASSGQSVNTVVSAENNTKDGADGANDDAVSEVPSSQSAGSYVTAVTTLMPHEILETATMSVQTSYMAARRIQIEARKAVEEEMHHGLAEAQNIARDALSPEQMAQVEDRAQMYREMLAVEIRSIEEQQAALLRQGIWAVAQSQEPRRLARPSYWATTGMRTDGGPQVLPQVVGGSRPYTALNQTMSSPRFPALRQGMFTTISPTNLKLTDGKVASFDTITQEIHAHAQPGQRVARGNSGNLEKIMKFFGGQ